MREDLRKLADQVAVLDLAGAMIANPERAMVSRAGVLALALATESFWAVVIEADLLVRALAEPVSGDPAKDETRETVIRCVARRVEDMLAAIRAASTEGVKQEADDGSRHS
jgi:hypothetical protein